MQIEIKNVHAFKIVDPWNTPYEAELFINGKHTAYIQSGGIDDKVRVTPLAPTDFPTLEQADTFCKQMSAQPSGKEKQAGVYYRKSLNYTIEYLMYDKLEEINCQTFQLIKKLRSRYSIIYGQPNTKGFSTVKLPLSVANYLRTKEGQRLLVGLLKTLVIPKLGPQDQVLNEDIPSSLVQKAYPVTGKSKTAPGQKVAQRPTQREKKR